LGNFPFGGGPLIITGEGGEPSKEVLNIGALALTRTPSRGGTILFEVVVFLAVFRGFRRLTGDFEVDPIRKKILELTETKSGGQLNKTL
jgi:hypothetical protein